MTYPFDCITDFMFFETRINPSDLILIPGGSHPQLMERAAELYHQGMAPYLLPSGGATAHVTTTEWAFLRDIGLQLGVPEQAILREDQATNTFDNARLSWNVIQEHGLQPKKVILVCKSYHARRTLLTYQTVFPMDVTIYVSPVTDKTGTTKENWFMEESKIRMVMMSSRRWGNILPIIYRTGLARSMNKDIPPRQNTKRKCLRCLT